MGKDTAEGLKDPIRVDTAQLRGHVDEVVRSSVEETLNALLQAEADQICKAGRYERSPERVDTRAGHYERVDVEIDGIRRSRTLRGMIAAPHRRTKPLPRGLHILTAWHAHTTQ
jgi:hypothetical protein